VSLDGAELGVEELAEAVGTRVHVVVVGRGRLDVHYEATVTPGAEPVPVAVGRAEAIVAVRQSRYAPSDALEAFARAELATLPAGAERGRAIGDWVQRRLVYTLGSSGPLDTAVDTLLLGRGVCRDFAHLTVALCRAVGIPARLASVYAPGLSPMDFHAVAEVAPDGTWEVVDATGLAPRPSLVRIATGRDAADTAFATTLEGDAELTWSSVTAVVEGDLPLDDHRSTVRLR
jgi:transglutaminase-like putative cysteine protease